MKRKGAAGEVKGAVKKAETEVVKEARMAKKAIERTAKPRAEPSRPPGHPPLPMVAARHGTGMVTRRGKGFSSGELQQVGLPHSLALRWGVMMDQRRRSVLEGNVAALRSWHTLGAKAVVGREVKAVEEGIKGAGEEVERELIAAEKEVVKAEKAVKKEAKKAEKAVRLKVAKPKGRAKKKP